MPTLGERIMQQALSLLIDLRVRLVDVLLHSLNPPIRPEIEDLWAQEAERRIDQVDRGEIEMVTREVVFERIRKRLREE